VARVTVLGRASHTATRRSLRGLVSHSNARTECSTARTHPFPTLVRRIVKSRADADPNAGGWGAVGDRVGVRRSSAMRVAATRPPRTHVGERTAGKSRCHGGAVLQHSLGKKTSFTVWTSTRRLAIASLRVEFMTRGRCQGHPFDKQNATTT
jgi:hypothetical protein